MPYAHTLSIALRGTAAHVVTIEVARDDGLPSITAVTPPEHPNLEIRDRVRAAITTAVPGAGWPRDRVTIASSPPEVPLTSAQDLAVAVAVLTAEGLAARGDSVAFVAEVGLDGRLQSTRGILAAVLGARAAGIGTVVVADTALAHLSVVDGITVLGAPDLNTVVGRLFDRTPLTRTPDTQPPDAPEQVPAAFTALAGHESARRAVEAAAAGGHHVGLIGPVGSGKTLLAQTLPALLPALSHDDALEVAAIHSLRWRPEPPARAITCRVPFVTAHHSTSVRALIGGGTREIYPGYLTLAHHGVLFLDEANEFPSATWEMLRSPLDEQEVRIARVDGTVRFPASFQLVVAITEPASNAPRSRCAFTPIRPALRNAGPVMDRIDLWATVSPRARSRGGAIDGDRYIATARDRVLAARERTTARWGGYGITTNAAVTAEVLREYPFPDQVELPIDTAVRVGALSLRGADRVRRLAWTLADLSGRDIPGDTDVRTALNLRQGRGH